VAGFGMGSLFKYAAGSSVAVGLFLGNHDCLRGMV